MDVGGDKFREQLRHYAELAASLGKKNGKEIEEYVRDLFQSKVQDRESTGALLDAVRARSKKGIDTVSELIRNEFRQEFEEVAKRGREEVAQFIEKIVCLIEERFGSSLPDGSVKRPKKEQVWRTDVGGPHSNGSGTHRTTTKSSSKSSADAPKAATPKKATPKKAGAKKAAEKAAGKKAAPKKRGSKSSDEG